MGDALNAGGRWTGDPLIMDTEDLQTVPPSEIYVKRCKSKEVGIQKRERETMNLYSHAVRAKFCKTDKPLSTAVYKAGGDLRQESQRQLFRR